MTCLPMRKGNCCGSRVDVLHWEGFCLASQCNLTPLIKRKTTLASIGIAAGHTRLTEGSRLHEHQRCYAATEMLIDLLRSAGHTVCAIPEALYDVSNDESLNKRVRFLNDCKTDLNVELHLNAGGGSYSTTLYWWGGEGGPSFLLAEFIENQMDTLLPWRSVGHCSEERFGRKGLAFLNKTKAPSVIVEPAFKDNPEHLQWIDSESFVADYAATCYLGIQCYAQKNL